MSLEVFNSSAIMNSVMIIVLSNLNWQISI